MPEYNLDCMPLEELRELAPKLTYSQRQYAEHKIKAIEHRLAGNICFAVVLESRCDRIYGALQENEKW
jgi:hypothetical protein